MKKIYLFAAAVALFAACSSNDDLVNENQVAQAQEGEGIPVNFDSYVNRGTTRAGLNDANVVIDDLKAAKVGFGVFAYYTNADNYDQSFTPNFMYNEHIYWNSTSIPNQWDYSPVKYWPNEFGSNAASDDVDKVSFFAYAPYISVNWASGKPNGTGDGTTYHADDNGDITMGIVGMKKNTDTGDPMVKYISTFYTDKQVDLLWGTVDAASWALKKTGTQTLVPGTPWKDVQHPAKTSTSWSDAQKVKFNFKHALAALNVTVDTKVNSTSPTNLGEPKLTKVFIRSVTFEGFDTKGALNLNNEVADKALWYNFDSSDELNNGAEVTIKDGRKDGKEGLTAATKEYAAINPTFVQNATWAVMEPDPVTDAKRDGVTGTPGNLFCKADGKAAADADPILVIPNGDPLKVTIEYDVLTKDDNLFNTLNDGVTHGSVVKNVITRYITSGAASSGSAAGPGTYILQNGKKYTVNLHLGLNSVEFDANVTEWADPAETGGADLPHNNYSVPATGNTINGTFTGATGTISIDGDNYGCTVTGTAASFIITVPANSTVSNKNFTLTLKDENGKTMAVNISQAAKPFVLKQQALANGGTTIDIEKGEGSGDVIDEQFASATIVIRKSTDNGASWTVLSGGGTNYSYAGTTGKGIVTLKTAAVAEEKYEITVTVGDTAPQTIMIIVSNS